MVVESETLEATPGGFEGWHKTPEQIEYLVQDFADIRVSLKGAKLRAPLESQTDESRRTEFLEQVLETLTG